MSSFLQGKYDQVARESTSPKDSWVTGVCGSPRSCACHQHLGIQRKANIHFCWRSAPSTVPSNNMDWRTPSTEAGVKNNSLFYLHSGPSGKSLVFCQTTYLNTKAKIFKNSIFTKTFQPHRWRDIHWSSMEIRKPGVLAAFWRYFIVHRGNKSISIIFKLVQEAPCAEISLQSDREVWLCVAIVFRTLVFFLDTHSNPDKNPVTFPGPLAS